MPLGGVLGGAACSSGTAAHAATAAATNHTPNRISSLIVISASEPRACVETRFRGALP
jgi:hypothetical protein